jgi:hypothetical protein
MSNKLLACSPAKTNAERAVGLFTPVRFPGRGDDANCANGRINTECKSKGGRNIPETSRRFGTCGRLWVYRLFPHLK